MGKKRVVYVKRRERLPNDGMVKFFDRERTIVIIGTIKMKMLYHVARALWALQNKNPIRPIFFVIKSSPGGDVIAALMIAALLRNAVVPITTYIEHLAASSAVFVFLAGRKRAMARNARLVIHPARVGIQICPAKDQRVVDYFPKVINRWLVVELRFAARMDKNCATKILGTGCSLSTHEALKLHFATHHIA